MDPITFETTVILILTVALIIHSVALLAASPNERSFHYLTVLPVLISLVSHLLLAFVATATFGSSDQALGSRLNVVDITSAFVALFVLNVEQLAIAPFQLLTSHLLSNAHWTLILFDVAMTWIMNGSYLACLVLGRVDGRWAWMFHLVGWVSYGIILVDVSTVAGPYLQALAEGEKGREKERLVGAWRWISFWCLGSWAFRQVSLALYISGVINSSSEIHALFGVLDTGSVLGTSLVFYSAAKNLDLGLLSLRFPETGRFGVLWETKGISGEMKKAR